MDNLLLYLLKVSVATMVLYLAYLLLFSRDTFYRRNRILLIGILLISILLPFLKISNFFPDDAASVSANPVIVLIASGSNIGAAVSGKITSFDVNNLLLWIYFSVAFIILMKVLVSLTKTCMIIRKGTILDNGFPKVVLTDKEYPPFSFFSNVVVPRKIYEDGDYLEILRHENAHVRQGHTFDRLLTELLIPFLWFNPFIWLIKRSVILNHEYLADNLTIKGAPNVKEYQYKLLSIAKYQMNIPLANNFSSLIKNRIIMINKKPTRNYAALKSIMILPVVAILFVLFSFKPESNTLMNGTQGQLFSKSSESEISKFIAKNIIYPLEAKNLSDTGRFFVVVKMNKGGVIKDCKFFTEKGKVEVPVLEEIVAVAYKNNSTSVAKSDIDHLALKAECLRIANKLSELQIPEWKDKNVEFAISINFQLR
ncbi:MAG: M56 family metallopeptidase [Bacteroidales bacterium]|nr:M56 family metallopeptidase [Bacteroidales bacterium]